MSFYEVVGTLFVTLLLISIPGICVFAHIYAWDSVMIWRIVTLCEIVYLWGTLMDHSRKARKIADEKPKSS